MTDINVTGGEGEGDIMEQREASGGKCAACFAMVTDKIQALLCELFGSTIFGTVYMVTLFNTANAVGMEFTRVHALGVGAAYMCLVFIGVNVSGGHYNPAVTFAMLISQQSFSNGCIQFCKDFCGNSLLAVIYMGFQVGGYIIAALFSRAIVGKENFGIKLGGVCVDPADSDAVKGGYDDCSRVVLTEMLVTFVLVVVVIAATSKSAATFVGDFTKAETGAAALTIGFAIVAGMSAAGNISGAVLNPALSIGLWFGQDTLGKDDDTTGNVEFLVVLYFVASHFIAAFVGGMFAITGVVGSGKN